MGIGTATKSLLGVKRKQQWFFSHGLGDSARGWVDGALYLATHVDGLRIVLPTAPLMRVTLNGGMEMRAWYDLVGLSSRKDETCTGLDASRDYINSIVTHEAEDGTPIILGGFSQGGALSLFTGIQSPGSDVPIICCSGYLPLSATVSQWKSPDVPAKDISFFHGTVDPMVRPEWVKESIEALKNVGCDTKIKWYEGMQHEAWPSELDDVASLLNGFVSKHTANSAL